MNSSAYKRSKKAWHTLRGRGLCQTQQDGANSNYAERKKKNVFTLTWLKALIIERHRRDVQRVLVELHVLLFSQIWTYCLIACTSDLSYVIIKALSPLPCWNGGQVIALEIRFTTSSAQVWRVCALVNMTLSVQKDDVETLLDLDHACGGPAKPLDIIYTAWKNCSVVLLGKCAIDRKTKFWPKQMFIV